MFYIEQVPVVEDSDDLPEIIKAVYDLTGDDDDDDDYDKGGAAASTPPPRASKRLADLKTATREPEAGHQPKCRKV